MSRDHKATDEAEIDRIKAVGGSVWAGRVTSGDFVFGGLAITRAFGDFQLKMNGKIKQEEQAVVTDPDIKVFDRSEITHIGKSFYIDMSGNRK